MQQKKTLILLWLIIISFTACKTDDNKATIISSFPKESQPDITAIQTAPVLLAPEEMFIIDNQIWVFQSQKDTLFDVFELPACNYLFSTGQKGQGPNDFIFPIGNTIQVTNEGFTILDMNIVKFVKPEPDGSLNVAHSVKAFNNIPVNGFIILNDSLNCAFTGCGDGSKSNYEYQIKNVHTNDVIEFSDYPNLMDKEYEGDERCQIYYKHLTANSKKEKFAAFYSFFKYFRIFTSEGFLEKHIYVKIPPYKSDNVEDWTKRMVYYGPPISTNQYIYAPCMGNEIQVWDWNGDPIIRYSLNQTFRTFTVCENTNKIYLISAKEENENKIFSFNLSHID